MKICIFGGSGFLGSHVADAATNIGHKVIIFDILQSSYLQKNQKMFIGDILNEKEVEKAIKGCDVVYNFAGVADIEEAKHKPVDTIKYNVLGNTIILNCCVKEKIKRFIYASSVYVYSKAGSFYRSSKQACELLIENFHEKFNLPYTILRYGSLYGPRTDFHNGVYRLLHQAITKGKIIFYGTGEETREFIHVLDAAKLSIEILKPRYENEYVILTGHQSIKMKDFFEMIKEMLKNKVKIVYNNSVSDIHYNMTPYVFNPRLGKKLISNLYIDMGQGLLECLSEMYAKENKNSYDKLGILIKKDKKKKLKSVDE